MEASLKSLQAKNVVNALRFWFVSVNFPASFEMKNEGIYECKIRVGMKVKEMKESEEKAPQVLST